MRRFPSGLAVMAGVLATILAAGCSESKPTAEANTTTPIAPVANEAAGPTANDAGNGAASADNGADVAMDAPPGAGSSDPMIGKPLPVLSMVSTTGEKITSASLKGKVAVLDFWATWCGPCKQASPTMELLHRKFAAKGVRVIGANAFERGNAEGAAEGYKKEHGYTYTFTKKNDEYAAKVSSDGSIPLFLFVDRKGIVRDVYHGFGPALGERMAKIVEQLAAEKA